MPPQLMTAQLKLKIKTAQSSYNTARSSLKKAQGEGIMPVEQEKALVEQVLEIADALAEVAVEAMPDEGMAVEPLAPVAPDPLGINGGGTPEPTPEPTAPIPGANPDDDPEKKLNTAKEDEDEETKIRNAEHDDMKKELDAMKLEKTQVKLAQTYSELYPLSMRQAKFDEFMGFKEPAALLEARVKTAMTILSPTNALKIAQSGGGEGELFKLENLEGGINGAEIVSPGAQL